MGPGEAHSTLDAIRATRQMKIQAGDDVVLWGHSQGGHAAMWTGILAPSYVPEIHIAGVAAIAPATDLKGLIDVLQHSLVGRIISSYLLRAFSDNYADVRFDAYSSGWKRVMARYMSTRCAAGLCMVEQTLL
jgi:pimeloyl-ACP methyl ester carboxylesterase